MSEKEQYLKLLNKYNYLLKLYKSNKLVLNRLLRKYVIINKKMIIMKNKSSKAVQALVEKYVEDKYQAIFDSKKRLVSVSDKFLKDIDFDRVEFAQSFYIDTLFDKYLPGIDDKNGSTDISPFQFPILIKNWDTTDGYPYLHFKIYGKLKFIHKKNDYFYFLTIEDITSEVELNYIQNTDYVIRSLSINNLYLQQAKKNVEVHKVMLILLTCSLVEEHNKETSEHLRRIQEVTTIISEHAKKMGVINIENGDVNEFVKDINYTSVFHDIGKMGVPVDILTKEGRLTPEEFDVVKKHTIIGANYIKKIRDFFRNDADYSSYAGFLNVPYNICLYHHERWDGSGYPAKMKGNEIPIEARIVSVADVYDAIRANRSYDHSRSHEAAVEIITKESGKQFDPDIVKAFLNGLEELKFVAYY